MSTKNKIQLPRSSASADPTTTLFGEPIFIKPTHPKGDVIVFGKSPDLVTADAKSGVARFGGQWRKPNYFTAYVQSAGILIQHAVQNNALDDIALPAFYMQRHALELLIKRLLSWLYEVAEYRSELGEMSPGVPSKQQRESAKGSHNLKLLLANMLAASAASGFPDPPLELAELVQSISSFEMSNTWSRYEMSESNGEVLRHTNDEVVLPLVDFQYRLELVVLKTTYRFDGGDSYENNLYYEWESVARATGRVC